uniref:Cysteine dioxygenase n=1 Tax=Rhabditophanes sp. KR3021 TaxID=114890 RepID=A0AC35U5F6_9BILA
MNLVEVCLKLREVFSDHEVNTEEVKDILSSYKSNNNDWKQYAKFDPHKYTRNLVDEGNGKYNLIVLCWGPGIASGIHDHRGSHCFVKVLDGEVTETKYDWPEEENEDDELRQIEKDTFIKNEVTYMSDKLGLHRMENESNTNNCVTLHLYIPAYDMCHCFDEHTGRKMPCNITFYSKYGKKVDYKNSKEGVLVEEK